MIIMGNKGNSRHLTSLAAPNFYGLHRKERFYVMRANPGRHSRDRSIPLQLALEKLSIAANKSEASKTIRGGDVLVNNKVVREAKYPVGLNDVLEFKKLGKSYKVGVDTHGRVTIEEAKADYDAMLFKVVGKYRATGGQTMARLHDGREVKAAKGLKVNDSVLISRKGEIKSVLPLKAGSKCVVIAGVHTGAKGTVKELKAGSMNIVASAVLGGEEGSNFETIIKNIMVTG